MVDSKPPSSICDEERTLQESSGGEAAGGQEGEDFMPMMQDLMQSLLSKSVLYPSLKEISSKVTVNPLSTMISFIGFVSLRHLVVES